MGTAVAIGSAIAALGSTAVSVSEQRRAQKNAERAAEKAAVQQEEALKKQGPQAQQVQESGTDAERLKRLRGGILSNIKAGSLSMKATTAGTALGMKTKLGD